MNYDTPDQIAESMDDGQMVKHKAQELGLKPPTEASIIAKKYPIKLSNGKAAIQYELKIGNLDIYIGNLLDRKLTVEFLNTWKTRPLWYFTFHPGFIKCEDPSTITIVYSDVGEFPITDADNLAQKAIQCMKTVIDTHNPILNNALFYEGGRGIPAILIICDIHNPPELEQYGIDTQYLTPTTVNNPDDTPTTGLTIEEDDTITLTNEEEHTTDLVIIKDHQIYHNGELVAADDNDQYDLGLDNWK